MEPAEWVWSPHFSAHTPSVGSDLNREKEEGHSLSLPISPSTHPDGLLKRSTTQCSPSTPSSRLSQASPSPTRHGHTLMSVLRYFRYGRYVCYPNSSLDPHKRAILPQFGKPELWAMGPGLRGVSLLLHSSDQFKQLYCYNVQLWREARLRDDRVVRSGAFRSVWRLEQDVCILMSISVL